MNRIIAKTLIFLPGQFLRGEYIPKYIHEFEKLESLDFNEIEKIQFNKLSRLLCHAVVHSPYYQKLFYEHGLHPSDIRQKKDLLKIPQLTKENLRNHQTMMVSKNKRYRFSKKITGGSTGQAVTILKDRKAMAYQDAAMWRSLRWHGIEIGDKQARFWGVPINSTTKRKYQCIDYLMNRVRFSAFNFSDESMRAFYEKIKRFKPKYFYGYVSLIREFAEFCSCNGLNDLDIGAIVTTSEILDDRTRRFLCDTFKCPVINDYGCGEVGPIAYNCPEGGFHLMSDNLYIEIINANGKHAENGEIGEVVVTELNNFSLPLIRYNLKDLAEVSNEQCSCRRGLPLIKRIVGRVLDTLIASDGKKVHGEYFNYIAEEIKERELGLKQYQVTQKNINHIQLKIVKGVNYSDSVQTYFEKKIKQRMGEGTTISFEFVDKIERERSGKLRLVKSEIYN